MKFKIFSLILMGSAIFFTGREALAATIPVAGVDVFIKSLATKLVIATRTDSTGNFSSSVPETNGKFNIFISDQSMTPIGLTAKGGIISGRIVVLTEGTTTKDPEPVKKTEKSIKKAATVQKTKSK